MPTQPVAGVQDKVSADSHPHVVRDEVTDASSSQADEPDGDQILNNVNKETLISDGTEKDQSPTRRTLISARVQTHSSPTRPSAAAASRHEKVISPNSRPVIDQKARHLSEDKPKSTIEVKRPSLADNRRKKLMAFLAATPPPPSTTTMPFTNVNNSSSKLVEPAPVSIDANGSKYMKNWATIDGTLHRHFVVPKKTEDLKKWLVSEGLGYARILIIRGPSGCGKTATIFTWKNKSSQQLEMKSETDNDDQDISKEDQVDQFCNFLSSASSYRTLQISVYSEVTDERVVTSNFPGTADKPLVIVREIPTAFQNKPEVLHEAISCSLRNYKNLGASPLVFILTDLTPSACGSYKLFPPKVLSYLQITKITWTSRSAPGGKDAVKKEQEGDVQALETTFDEEQGAAETTQTGLQHPTKFIHDRFNEFVNHGDPCADDSDDDDRLIIGEDAVGSMEPVDDGGVGGLKAGLVATNTELSAELSAVSPGSAIPEQGPFFKKYGIRRKPLGPNESLAFEEVVLVKSKFDDNGPPVKKVVQVITILGDDKANESQDEEESTVNIVIRGTSSIRDVGGLLTRSESPPPSSSPPPPPTEKKNDKNQIT